MGTEPAQKVLGAQGWSGVGLVHGESASDVEMGGKTFSQ